MITCLGNITPEDYEVVDTEFTMLVKHCYPCIIKAYYAEEWVPIKYAISPEAAERFIADYQKDNNLNFTIQPNESYNPTAIKLAIEEMFAFIQMLLNNVK